MNKDTTLTWIHLIISLVLQAIVVLVTILMFASSRFDRVESRIDKLYDYQVQHLSQLHAKPVAEK